MKTTKIMNVLGAEDLKEVNGGRMAVNVGVKIALPLDFHIHCIQPEPGTCSCTPNESPMMIR